MSFTWLNHINASEKKDCVTMQSKKVCFIESWLGQKKHVLSSASRNLKSSFLVTRILCKSLNENCLSLLSLVE